MGRAAIAQGRGTPADLRLQVTCLAECISAVQGTNAHAVLEASPGVAPEPVKTGSLPFRRSRVWYLPMQRLLLPRASVSIGEPALAMHSLQVTASRTELMSSAW